MDTFQPGHPEENDTPAERVSPARQQSAGRARLFISYSRKDREFVRRFASALADAGYEVWVDLKDIQASEDWLAAIHSAIDRTDAFVFVVSPDSVDAASVCKTEVDYAVERRKRIIPVAFRSVDTRAAVVPEAVARLNWISFLDPALFESGLELLKSAIETDLDWVREHTRLTVRAAEWQRANRDDSFVLQKNDLLSAEAWLKRAQDKQPPPAAEQTGFVLASRAVAERRRRRLVVSAMTAVSLTAVALTIAWFQAREAAQRRAESQARAWAAEAQFERTRRLDRAIVLATQALQSTETPETADAALAVARQAQDVVRILRGHRGAITALCIVSGGRQLVSAGRDGQVILWDLVSGSPIRRLAVDERMTIACNPGVAQVALSGRALELWDVSSDGAKRTARLEETGPPSADFAMPFFSGDGRWLATLDDAGIVIRSAANAEPVVAVPSITDDSVSSMALSHDGSRIALGTVGSDIQGYETPSRVVMWHRGASKPAFAVNAFALAVRSVGISADGSSLFAVGKEGELQGWKADGAEKQLSISSDLRSFESRAAEFDSSGASVVTANGRSASVVVLLETPDNFQLLQPLAAHERVLTAVAIDLRARRVASGSEDGAVIVHALRVARDLDGGQVVSVDNELVDDASFSADGRFVVFNTSSSAQHAAPVRALPFGEQPPLPASAARAEPGPYSVAHDGERAVLKRAGKAEPLGEIVPEPGVDVLSSATTADGLRWAAATENTMRLRGANDAGTVVASLPPDFGLISAIAISPDGKLAAVAGGDATNAMGVRVGMTNKAIVLVDTQTGRALGPPFRRTMQSDVSRLEFSPDGKRLLSVGAEVAVWLVDPRQWLQRACAALAVGIDAPEWEKRLPGVPRPRGC